ncbi:DNA adenine methylase [Polynucleobacter paneuropaeus]|nr:DNA adenine methylase [Polynucleobacter paneuropaeus]MBT8636922.1 DNA adenine methylase [Polynucleobacter paneuropaeus]MBT8638858.1 DNA adenine methylase [Polynucleobacter paneuropaeus]
MSAKLDKYIKSPFNYTGGKYRILNQIIPRLPSGINLFMDVFSGGGNVFINAPATHFYVNDIDVNVIRLFEYMHNHAFEDFVVECKKVIHDFGLSSTAAHGYEFYGANSNSGVGSFNRPGYTSLKDCFNQSNKGYSREVLFFILICYGFNNQIRYNSSNKFNIPVGKRDLNERVLKNLEKFCTRLGSLDVQFESKSFFDIDYSSLSNNDFVYFDPPYLTSNASYNESGKWSNAHEEKLINLMDRLVSLNVRFGLSNMTRSGDIKNESLNYWIKSNAGRISMFNISSNYTNSNYQKKIKNSSSENEIFLVYPAI